MTPRTDAQLWFMSPDKVPAEFARELEREVTALSAELAEKKRQFQLETLRTSVLSQMLIKFIDHHSVEHTPGAWSRGCETCALVQEGMVLLSKPINVGTEVTSEAEAK